MFSIGFTLIPLSLAGLAAHYKVSPRLTWTVVGIILASYWLSPWNIGEKLLGRELKGDIEMFLLSGVMVVIAVHADHRLQRQAVDAAVPAQWQLPLPRAARAAASGVALRGGGFALGDRGDGLGQLCSWSPA